MSLQSALDACQEALTVVEEEAIDAPAARLLELLGHPVPASFERHRGAFIEALAQALYAEGDEPRVRIAIRRFAALAGRGGVPWYECGDDWAPEPPPRTWLVPGWFPAARIALLAGEGGAGKSRLALQLCAALAQGKPDWLPGGGPALAIDGSATAVFTTYEDEHDQVARVLHSAGVQEAVGNRLRYVAPDGPLWAPDPRGSRHTSTAGALTPAGAWLREYCETRDARLLVIDPSAAAYSLNENDRALVRGFMSHWDLWARASGCSVLLISHPPKSDSDYSGSTDWHAASRAVWVLGVADTGIGEQVGEGPRSKRRPAPAPRLECRKSSYARRPEPHWLEGYPSWRAVSGDAGAEAYRRRDPTRPAPASDGVPPMPAADV
ncbi:MAG: AAA family ATPase [Gammaproteobacteria bacterium]|nr:AAA family ATPase [Gammaproteobacteria bacterium]